MSLGYCADLADAEDYFAIERLETEAWDDLGSGSGHPGKDKVIVMAYNRLFYDPRWDLPIYATATVSELITLRKANCEMAYYLAMHNADEDRRKGIQAQGVIEAGIVKERYSESWLSAIPVPPIVIGMLLPWSTERRFGAINLIRDEREEKIKF